MAYRSTPHSSTGVAPFSLLFGGREMRTKLPGLCGETDPTVFEKAADFDARAKHVNKENVDKRLSSKDIEIGDQVLMRKEKGGKLDGNFESNPKTVVAKEGSEIIVRDESGKQTRRNSTFVKVLPDAVQLGPGNQSTLKGANRADCSIPLAPNHDSTRPRHPPERYGDIRVH